MPEVTHDSIDADALANTIFTTLTNGVTITIPTVDLSGPEFDIPDFSENPLYNAPTQLTEASLVSREVAGTGMFDGVMESISQHLKQEYDNNRITGEDYAKTWLASMQAALGNSVQFLLQKDTAFYQTRVIQLQAQAAEIAVVSQRIELEMAKVKLASLQIEANNVKANFALTKMQLATEDAKYHTMRSQHRQTDYQTDQLMPAQISGLQTDNLMKVYQLDEIMPLEKTKLTKENEALTSEISLSGAKIAQVQFETAQMLPAQKVGIEADNSIKTYQLITMLPAQTAGVTADNAAKAYTNEFILPAQLVGIRENNESNRAKTLNTRSDGATVTGAIGKQIALQQQQIDSFKRDSEAKVMKMLLDTWVTQKSMDEGLVAPSSLADSNINRVMDVIRVNNGLT